MTPIEVSPELEKSTLSPVIGLPNGSVIAAMTLVADEPSAVRSFGG